MLCRPWKHQYYIPLSAKLTCISIHAIKCKGYFLTQLNSITSFLATADVLAPRFVAIEVEDDCDDDETLSGSRFFLARFLFCVRSWTSSELQVFYTWDANNIGIRGFTKF